MIFNSVEFFIFFSVFFVLYWFVSNRNLSFQNILLLIGSYIFYAWWDWRFLSLLIGSSLLNYYLGLGIWNSKTDKKKKGLLLIGLVQGLGGLIFFKYVNFFVDSFLSAFSFFNIDLNLHAMNLILPLGISFYTFRTVSYLLDIYKGKIEPSHNPIVFFSYVAFFPSLISGPIDRASTLIPQLEKNRNFDYDQAVDGCRQILWGLFKKFVVADNCGLFTKLIFNDYHELPGSSLLLGAFYYTIQIYADFSGYSDMAIGFAKLLGFNITKNFDYPFFSQNIAGFWRKWHISLTSWLTDFVFTPLTIAFRDYGKVGLILAIIINFTTIGLWHGANWTFILFGFLHGCYYIPLIIRGTLSKKNKIADDKLLPSFSEFIYMSITFIVVMLTFIVFRSDTISQAVDYFARMFSSSFLSIPKLFNKITTGFIIVLIAVEWLQRSKQHGLQITNISNPFMRKTLYFITVLIIFIFGAFNNADFLYFKF